MKRKAKSLLAKHALPTLKPLPKRRKKEDGSVDDATTEPGFCRTSNPDGCGYSFEKKTAPYPLHIEQIPTSKDKIEQPELAAHEDMFIPPLGSSCIISGKSGSGKSTLLANLFRDERFYGPGKKKKKGWFDKIFLFSPTANGDDVQKSLGVDKKYVFTDLDEAPELLEVILQSQQKKLDVAEGADKVEQYAIIFDDVIGDVQFMNEKAFTQCFYQVRHVNCTTFICTQHFKRVPRICRLQANFVYYFQGSASEVEVVVEEFAPPQYSKNEMRQMITDATKEDFSFLTICMKKGWDKRFRKNLDEFIHLERLDNNDTKDKDKDEDTKDKGESKRKKCATNCKQQGEEQKKPRHELVSESCGSDEIERSCNSQYGGHE